MLGGVSYGTFSYFAWQFTGAAAEYFAEHPMDSAFYFVQRLSSLARVVVVGLGALGTGVSAIAGAGQLALAVQVAIGIAQGEVSRHPPPSTQQMAQSRRGHGAPTARLLCSPSVMSARMRA